MKKANVTLKSNIYVLKEDSPFQDNRFLCKITDLQTLERIAWMIRTNKLGNVRIELQQWALLDRGMPCSVHPDYERPFGLVKSKTGLRMACRCTALRTCKYARAGKCEDLL